MTSYLFLLGIAVCVMVVGSIFSTAKTKALTSKLAKVSYIPKAVSVLILTAQISELVKVVEHTNIVTVTAALMLLAIVIATKSGTEGEMH